MKKFETRKGFEEIQIGSKVFKLDISDKALGQFAKGSPLFLELAKDGNDDSVENASNSSDK